MADSKQFTMYSGGHVGAESFFGECAERWGVREVTYSFAGHFLKRDKNVVMLDEKALMHGDISMDIVSGHMQRKYSDSETIRRVLQSIFHMVNNGLQVFAVGNIQKDNTVKGGTGWGVELGKFLNRNVHVYDKEQKSWFTWKSGAWQKDLPVIHEQTFCGTGTREMTPDCEQAVRDLFERSFGKGK